MIKKLIKLVYGLHLIDCFLAEVNNYFNILNLDRAHTQRAMFKSKYKQEDEF